MHRLLPLLLLLLPFTLHAQAVQDAPVYMSTGETPTGACIGTRVWVDAASGSLYCCNAGTWTACGTSALDAHEAAVDPHSQYLQSFTEADPVASAALTNHAGDVGIHVPNCTVGGKVATWNEVDGNWYCGDPPSGSGATVPTTSGILRGDGAGGIATTSWTGSCSVGSSIRSISSTGSVSCEVDDTGTSSTTKASWTMARTFSLNSGGWPLQPSSGPLCLEIIGDVYAHDPAGVINATGPTTFTVDNPVQAFTISYEFPLLIDDNGGPMVTGSGALFHAFIGNGGIPVVGSETWLQVTGSGMNAPTKASISHTLVTTLVGTELEVCIEMVDGTSGIVAAPDSEPLTTGITAYYLEP